MQRLPWIFILIQKACLFGCQEQQDTSGLVLGWGPGWAMGVFRDTEATARLQYPRSSVRMEGEARVDILRDTEVTAKTLTTGVSYNPNLSSNFFLITL